MYSLFEIRILFINKKGRDMFGALSRTKYDVDKRKSVSRLLPFLNNLGFLSMCNGIQDAMIIWSDEFYFNFAFIF